MKRYLATVQTILLQAVQGEAGYETGLGIVFSIANPHSAYIAWMASR